MFATFLATTMILVFVIANIIRQKKSGKWLQPTTNSKYGTVSFIFIAGATAANGLFHFVHGILGCSDFPAPFAVMAESAIFTNIANVIWGLLNFAVATFVTLSYRKAVTKRTFVICFVIGFAFIAAMLRFVLLIGYFQTHAF